MSHRLERVASVIQAVLGRAIPSELNDPRIPTITSVTRVEVSADFAVAHVYVSIMAPDSRRELAMTALRSASGRLRWLLGRELRLRKTPALDFRLDDSIRRSFETVQTLDRLMAELQPLAGAADAVADAALPAPPGAANAPPAPPAAKQDDPRGRAGAAGAQEDA